jgi:hypothetical protein
MDVWGRESGGGVEGREAGLCWGAGTAGGEDGETHAVKAGGDLLGICWAFVGHYMVVERRVKRGVAYP